VPESRCGAKSLGMGFCTQRYEISCSKTFCIPLHRGANACSVAVMGPSVSPGGRCSLVGGCMWVDMVVVGSYVVGSLNNSD